MTKSKPSLKSLAKRGLLLSLCAIVLFLAGCTSSTSPTYNKEKIDLALEDICKKEYNLGVKAKLVGQTLWVYLPLDHLFEIDNKPPAKSIERFRIDQLDGAFTNGIFKLEYAIKPTQQEKESPGSNVKYSKDAMEKLNNVWKVLRRILFSLERTEANQPKLFYLVIADIQNGFEENGVKKGLEVRNLFYYLDVKKVSYEFISWGEYQHRTVQETVTAPEILGDKEGLHLDYRDIPLSDFILAQIKHRIQLKFQKPEVDKNADIDKEIIKAIVYTVKTYEFRDFAAAELNNLLTKNRIILNQAAIRARPIE